MSSTFLCPMLILSVSVIQPVHAPSHFLAPLWIEPKSLRSLSLVIISVSGQWILSNGSVNRTFVRVCVERGKKRGTSRLRSRYCNFK